MGLIHDHEAKKNNKSLDWQRHFHHDIGYWLPIRRGLRRITVVLTREFTARNEQQYRSILVRSASWFHRPLLHKQKRSSHGGLRPRVYDSSLWWKRGRGHSIHLKVEILSCLCHFDIQANIINLILGSLNWSRREELWKRKRNYTFSRISFLPSWVSFLLGFPLFLLFLWWSDLSSLPVVPVVPVVPSWSWVVNSVFMTALQERRGKEKEKEKEKDKERGKRRKREEKFSSLLRCNAVQNMVLILIHKLDGGNRPQIWCYCCPHFAPQDATNEKNENLSQFSRFGWSGRSGCRNWVFWTKRENVFWDEGSPAFSSCGDFSVEKWVRVRFESVGGVEVVAVEGSFPWPSCGWSCFPEQISWGGKAILRHRSRHSWLDGLSAERNLVVAWTRFTRARMTPSWHFSRLVRILCFFVFVCLFVCLFCLLSIWKEKMKNENEK